MNFELIPAKPEDVADVFSIIEKRVNWMAEKGLKQWNTTDYLNTYPISYFMLHQKAGSLYVAKDIKTSTIIGVMVLMPSDPRWEGYNALDSYFVHNFASDPSVSNIGAKMLLQAEMIAFNHGKAFLRLDCPFDNTYLNNFYESKGYRSVGECTDGPYHGNRREKKLR